MNRFSYSKPSRDLLNKAVALDILDAIELGCLMAELGTNVPSIVNEINEFVWASRHHFPAAERLAWHKAVRAYRAAA